MRSKLAKVAEDQISRGIKSDKALKDLYDSYDLSFTLRRVENKLTFVFTFLTSDVTLKKENFNKLCNDIECTLMWQCLKKVNKIITEESIYTIATFDIG